MITLILSPHIDDEVLGCGGLINQRVKSGNKVFVQYFGVEDYHEVSKVERLKEAENVSKFLGFDFDISNNIVNNYELNKLTIPITDLINNIRPDEIFIPHKSYNQDHNVVHEAALIALRPHDRNHFVKNVYIYEVDQYQIWGNYTYHPNYFVSIDIEAKIKAYNLHISQVRLMRPPQMLEHFASIRGYSINVKYAEGFIVLRSI